MNEPRYVIVANPDGKRWRAYERDLRAFWQKHGREPQVNLIPWREAVLRRGKIDDLLEGGNPAIFRLESPGRDQEVMRLLLEAGDDSAGSHDWRSIPIAKGILIRPSLLHLGFCRTLQGIRAALDRNPTLLPLCCPLAVAEMFDKTAAAHRLSNAGLPCPASFPVPSAACELMRELRTHAFKIAYVKINTGSSAAGIAVVHALDDRPWAITSMVRIGTQFYNTRKLQKVSGTQLDDVLNFLILEGAFAQEGISMAQIDGQNFDLRVVVIHGEPAFTIFRLSGLPMTNLHLGGRRGDWVQCRAAIPTRAWLDALDHCVEAAKLFECSSAGVDLVFERGCARHFILEINAFGDFFPGLPNDAGRTVHETEIMMTAQKFGLLH